MPNSVGLPANTPIDADLYYQHAASKIQVQGGRYSEAAEKMTNL